MPPEEETNIALSELDWGIVTGLLVRASGELKLPPNVAAQAYAISNRIGNICLQRRAVSTATQPIPQNSPEGIKEMPPDAETNSTPSDDESKDVTFASVSLTPKQWLFILSCLNLVYQSHYTQTKECRDHAYYLECRIIEGIAEKRNAP